MIEELPPFDIRRLLENIRTLLSWRNLRNIYMTTRFVGPRIAFKVVKRTLLNKRPSKKFQEYIDSFTKEDFDKAFERTRCHDES